MNPNRLEPFAESTEKGGHLAISQEQIDEAIEMMCNDPEVVDLTQKPLDLAIIIANKAKQWILANSAENCREDLLREFTEERILDMRNQALNLIFDKFPDTNAPPPKSSSRRSHSASKF